MAEAYGKLTGRPGVCLVTRGPGATHAANGVHTAFQDSTPMLLLIGQVARAAAGREGFQELDYRAMYGPIAKWATQVDDAARLPEIVARAFADRDVRAARPGGDRAAGGHAHRSRRRSRRAPLPGPGRGSRRARAGAAGRAAGGRRAAADRRRRGRLDGADRRRPGGVRGGAARPRGRVVALPGLRRQRVAGLCRPRRTGHGSGAGEAAARGGSADRGRRPPGGDHLRGLHARAPRGAGAAAGARASGPGRARRGLSPRARHRLRARALRRRGAGAPARGRRAAGGPAGGGARRVPRQPPRGARAARPACSWRR